MTGDLVPISFVDSEESLWNGETPRDAEGRPHRTDLTPGLAAWVSGLDGRTAALSFVCPCGCGAVGAITITREGVQEKGWEWDGSYGKPTLKPSIQKTSPCRWHGWLIDGVFKTA